jgi:hypothetical protein
MPPASEYQSPRLEEIGSLHELTLQEVTVTKIGTNADVLTSLTGATGDITNFSVN